MTPKNPFILVSKGQRSRSRVHRYGSLDSYECLLIVVIAVVIVITVADIFKYINGVIFLAANIVDVYGTDCRVLDVSMLIR